MFHRLDMYFKTPHGFKELYSSLGVKLHGYLFSRIPQNLAAQFHRAEPVPISAFVCESEDGNSIYRICTLQENAECFLEPLQKVTEIPIYGLNSTLKVTEIIDYQKQYIDAIKKMPTLSECDCILTSPATYKKDGKYSNWFDLRGLMRSVAQKLAAFENIEISSKIIDEIAAKTEITSYRFESGCYLLAKSSIPCFIGGAHMKWCGDKALAKTASLLFRYAEYAGAGAKTAMGMGGIILNTEVK